MTTGLPAFDRTVQETNLWLKPLEDGLGVPRPQALASLRAVLHALRDRLPPQTALNFADQLPLLLRGVLVEGWRLSSPTHQRTWDEFADSVAERLPAEFPRNGEEVAHAVAHAMSQRMDRHEVSKLLAHLPRPLRDHWLLASAQAIDRAPAD